MSTLYFGDNLDILRNHIPAESVDLIYLDPPFNSQQSYNVLFSSPKGQPSEAQITAFDDTWHWGTQAEREYEEIVHSSNTDASEVIQALRRFLGENDMLAYLTMMTNRLLELHRVLKPTGSLYLHCDPTASHYLKIVLDSVFGGQQFKNEIIWSYKRYTAASNRFQRLHDVILFYAKSPTYTFNDIREAYGEKSGKADSHYKQDEDGQWYRWQKRLGQEPYKIYLSEGRRQGDVWEIPIINASAKERLGYPTQKPLELLERIVMASSNVGDVMLDPFCGCGTSIHAAQKLNREWVGIDITHLAISLVEKRLRDAFIDIEFTVEGTPEDIAGARDLAIRDKYQFQWWACSLVNAQPYQGKKKGADQGIDGLIFFTDIVDNKPKTQKIIVSVKGGDNVGVTMIRELITVVQQQGAEMGFLVSLIEPTQPMTTEAAKAGFYRSANGQSYPRIQILPVGALLSGRLRPEYMDYRHGEDTFKKAQREDDHNQPPLF